MEAYRRSVQYYETDKMGITHHANYIHWMEEARLDFMSRLGFPFDELERQGIASPVTALSARYRASTTYPETVLISVGVQECGGIRLKLTYRMVREANGREVFTGESEHCFLDREGRLLNLKRACPAFYEAMNRFAEET